MTWLPRPSALPGVLGNFAARPLPPNFVGRATIESIPSSDAGYDPRGRVARYGSLDRVLCPEFSDFYATRPHSPNLGGTRQNEVASRTGATIDPRGRTALYGSLDRVLCPEFSENFAVRPHPFLFRSTGHARVRAISQCGRCFSLT